MPGEYAAQRGRVRRRVRRPGLLLRRGRALCGYYEMGLKPWDAAAGTLIVEKRAGA